MYERNFSGKLDNNRRYYLILFCDLFKDVDLWEDGFNSFAGSIGVELTTNQRWLKFSEKYEVKLLPKKDAFFNLVEFMKEDLSGF